MEKIIGQEFIGERPLYCRHGLYLENVKIHRGESALKETSDITAVSCVFEGKYPFWCCENFIVRNCLFTGGARAALWYSKNVEMTDTYVDAPKMFREMDGIKLKNVQANEASVTPGQQQAPLDDEWIYQVMELTHVGDTRGNDWYTEIQGISRYGKGSLAALLGNSGQNGNGV